MLNNDPVYCEPLCDKAIEFSCRYVIVAPIRKSPVEEAIDNVFAHRDRMVNLMGQQSRTVDKKREFLEVYATRAHGVISIACRIVGIKSRKTIYNWMEKDPDFKKAMDDMVSYENDFMEDMLMALICKGHSPSIRYFLSHRHPDYIQKRSSRPPYKKVDQWEKWDRIPWSEDAADEEESV